MIYTFWGEPVRVISSHGEHIPEGCQNPVTLLTVKSLEDDQRYYYFAQVLRADGGWQEISYCIDMQPYVAIMDDDELTRAIREAS